MDWNALYFSALGSLIFFSAIFCIAVYRDRYDIIDVAWGFAFMTIAFISFTTYEQTSFLSAQVLVTALVAIWGLRLSLHIYQRWEKSNIEDKRYTAYRQSYSKKFGGFKINIYVRIFVLQALLAVVVSLPVIVVNSNAPVSLSYISLVGCIVWAVGFYFESVGDYQLKKFIGNIENKGMLMTKGVWKYTRHPNYFGEMTQWWGIFIIALTVPAYWWLSIIGPLVISILLLFISGVPLTEKHFASKPGWEDYKKRTSKLLPLPSKKRST